MSAVTLEDLDTTIDGSASGAQQTGAASTVTMDDLGPAMDAPDNSVYHEPSGRILNLPQTLDAKETQYAIDKEIDGKKDFFAMQPRTPEEAMGQVYESIYRRLAGQITSLPGEVAGVVARQSQIAQDRILTGKTQESASAGPLGIPKLARDLIFGSPKVLEAAQRVKERNERWVQEAGFRAKPGNEVAQFVSDATGAFGQAGAAVFMRMPKLAVLAQSAFQQSDAFEEAKKRMSIEDAATYSDQQFAWNLATESVGTAFLFKAIAEDTVTKAVKKSFLTESTQEGGQNVGQDLISNDWEVTNKDTKDILVDSAYSALLGGLTGGSIGGIGATFQKEAENRGINTELASMLSKHFEEQLTDMPSLMADFLDREVRPIADSDHDAKTFLQVMDTAGNDPKAVDTGTFSESDQAIFDQFLKMFNQSAANPQGVASVEQKVFENFTSRGLDQEQAVGAAKLIGAYSEAAARATGETPMQWYSSINLDLEVQRTPEDAMKSYEQKLAALNADLPDAATPAPEKTMAAEDAAIKADELAGIEKRLTDAKGGTRDVSMKKPIIKYLKGLGGIRTDGLIYGELKHLGIDRQSAVGLFNNKDTALRDIDNIPVEEFNRALGVAAKDDGNGYVDRDWLLEALRDEQFGQRMGQERPVADDSFLQALDKAGLDYRTATAEQVYEALGSDGDIVVAAADMGVELTPKEVRQVRGIMERNPDMYAQDAIDDFIERSAIMGDKLFQRDGEQAVIPGAEKATDKQVAEKGMEGRLKPKKAQKPMDEGMFGDAFKQQTLFQYYQRGATLQRMYDHDLLEKLETLAGYKGDDAKKEAFLERAQTNTLTEADLALKKDVVDAAKRVGGRLYQSSFAGPQFFSAVQRNIEALNQPKGSPEQWAGIIRNLTQKGVKQEEIDWLGVMDWLKEQKGSVTKEQVLDYLRANEVKVEEVLKSEPKLNTKSKYYVPAIRKAVQITGDNPGEILLTIENDGDVYRQLTAKFPELREDENWAETVVDSVFGTRTKETKFGQHTLPGGENYRELLMTLPVQETLPIGMKRDAEGNIRDAVGSVVPSDSPLLPKIMPEQGYRSSHYAEGNILAHIRFNERTDADGKRTMFIEEVQSDWHQAGRDKGYIDPEQSAALDKQKAEFVAESKKLIAIRDDLLSKETAELNKGRSYNEVTAEFGPQLADIKDKIDAIYWQERELDNKRNSASSAVPDSPFKTTWPELAFKRALMWAVENNFDSVAWTTGEQQADRYDLSKQVEQIYYKKNEDGTYALSIIAKNGNEIESASREDYTLKQIEDTVGKEIAKKIENGEGGNAAAGDGLKFLKGVDLKVGGEGMKAFYDKMLPSMVNKLVKKWGGKVGSTKIRGGETLSRLLPDPVHSLEITPAMRESIAQGLPLFQEGARGAITFGRDKTLIQLFQDANPSTLLHELGHFFLRDMDRIAKSTRRPMVKKDFEAVKKWLGSKDGKFTEAQEEKFARGFEAYLREGKAPTESLKPIFARFKDWLTSIYKSVKDLNVEINDDVRAVFDRMLGADYAKSEQQIKQRDTAKLEQDYKTIEEQDTSDFWDDAGAVLSGGKQMAANMFTPVSSRLGRIDPTLKAALRRYNFEMGMSENADRKRVLPFLESMNKMSEADYKRLDFAMKNRDETVVNEIAAKYNVADQFAEVRNLLDDIYNEATAVGLDVAYLENYYPRLVRLDKSSEFMATLRGRADWSLIEEALKDADPMNVFTSEEQAAFVNKWLRGHAPNATLIALPSFIKDRVIDYVEPQWNRFYLESPEALLKYISAMRLGIAQKKIFGKGANAEESVGAYVLNLVKTGAIKAEQENEVKMIFNVALNSKGPGVFVSWMKNAGYIYLMGSPISAITQIGDLAFALAKNGYYNTGVSLAKAIAGKSILKKEDLGIANIAQEFEDNSHAGKLVQKTFRVVGLEYMDNLGKQVYIESAYKRLRSEAKNNGAQFKRNLEAIFGDQAASVRADLMDGTLSDNVKMLLFSELSDVQPVSLAEMPVGYLKGGNWRALYMLKTYTVKQIDTYRREVFDKMASGDAAQVKEGSIMMIRLATALMLTGMGADALKDLLLGRAITLSELFMDNLLKLTGLTKYQIYQSRQQGVGNTIMQMLFVPPLYAPFDNLIKDVQRISAGKTEFEDALTFSYVPMVGKFYYWWVGGGRTKEEKKAGKGGKAKETW